MQAFVDRGLLGKGVFVKLQRGLFHVINHGVITYVPPTSLTNWL